MVIISWAQHGWCGRVGGAQAVRGRDTHEPADREPDARRPRRAGRWHPVGGLWGGPRQRGVSTPVPPLPGVPYRRRRARVPLLSSGGFVSGGPLGSRGPPTSPPSVWWSSLTPPCACLFLTWGSSQIGSPKIVAVRGHRRRMGALQHPFFQQQYCKALSGLRKQPSNIGGRPQQTPGARPVAAGGWVGVVLLHAINTRACRRGAGSPCALMLAITAGVWITWQLRVLRGWGFMD